MRILVLTSSYLAPTYNEKIISQVRYINSFPDMYAELCNDCALYEIEQKIISKEYDCVFPAVVFDSSHHEKDPILFNATLYQILLYHEQEYIGSDLYTQLLLNDKALTGHRSGMGLPAAIITRILWEHRRPSALQLAEGVPYPVIVKPNTLSASVGITKESVAYSVDEAAAIIDRVFRQFPTLTEILLEHYLEAGREYTVSVTGNSPHVLICPTALEPVGNSFEIYSYDSKRMNINKRPIAYKKVSDPVLAQRLSECGKKLAEGFALRDYSRFDILADEKQKLYLIDANTIPALGANYMYPYTSTGEVQIEQLLAILVAVFSKRTGVPLPHFFLEALPSSIMKSLGF